MGLQSSLGPVLVMTFRPKQFIRNWVLAFIAPRPLVGVFYLPRYFWNWYRFRKLGNEMPVELADSYPCLTDWSIETPFDAHYFYQGAWLARKIGAAKPTRHVDVGSSVMTIGVLSAFVDTLFIDYRPLRAGLVGLQSVADNITRLSLADDSVESLSCLHVIEHIGLGRYGDPLDPEGSLRASAELKRVLMPGGMLFLSTPVGRERVCFNAHRVFSPESIPAMLPELDLVEFSFVDDTGRFLQSQPVAAAKDNEYGCGMYVFRKPGR